MTKKILVTISENYTQELRERLEEQDISLGALAREMEIDRSQLARWFNTDMQPRIDNVLKIETAIINILVRREREEKRAAKRKTPKRE
jgi:ribosome-binding protein aMBF1 (putative translation factor)